MRIPILIAAPPATQFSGFIPLPVGRFRLSIVGAKDSILTLNDQPVVDGIEIDGAQTVQIIRQSGSDRSITIFAERVKHGP